MELADGLKPELFGAATGDAHEVAAEQTFWSRGEIVMKAGWASLDGTTTVNDAPASTDHT